MAVTTLTTPLRLPCGAVLTNRLAKAAMTEGLADPQNRATPKHEALYRRWAKNGLGMMLTGNVHVDRRQLERPGNIAIDGNGGLDNLKRLAKLGTQNGAHFWMQINHPGRQTAAAIHPRPLAASAISLPVAEVAPGEAQAMTNDQIIDVIKRFVHVATTARESGFTGVEIHAAHGYLLSNFLSPQTNTRTDEWGGSLKNRAGLLLEVIRSVRKAVGADYPIAVKLNSADFQRGGFSEEESMQVVGWLSDAKIDLLEISGGSYEQMQMVGAGDAIESSGRPLPASTAAREAYFLEYAKKVRPVAKMPLMISGGMRTVETMNQVLASGACDLIGIGRPLCSHPEIGGELLSGRVTSLPSFERQLKVETGGFGPDVDATKHKTLESFAQLGWFCLQLIEQGAGREPNLKMAPIEALQGYAANEAATVAAWDRPPQ